MLFSPRLLAEIPQNLKPDYSCLTLQEKSVFAIAIKENNECQIALAQKPSSDLDVKTLAISGLTGLILGFVVASLLHP